MQAVILAGGRGSRFTQITENTPKPLVEVRGKPLIFRVLDVLPKEITEYVIVIGYLGNLVRETMGKRYRGKPIRYVKQAQPGSGGALLATRGVIRIENHFLVVGSDDIFGVGELSKLIRPRLTYGVYYGIPSKPSTERVLFNGQNTLLGSEPVADPKVPRHFGVGAYFLSHEYFFVEPHKLPNGEFSIPHTLVRSHLNVEVVPILEWLPVNDSGEKQTAEAYLLNRCS